MKKTLLLATFVVIIFTGCSTKVNVKALKPAEAEGVSSLKVVSVLDFRNDRYSLGKNIEAELTGYKINNKNYFTVVDKDKKSILNEQALRESGVYGSDLADDSGDITGARAFISGDITKQSVNDTNYREKRSECIDKKCKRRREWSVSCTKRVGIFTGIIKVIDISSSNIVYSNNFSQSASWSKCQDESYTLPGKDEIFTNLSKTVAKSFVLKVAPSYVHFSVTLLDDPDIDFNGKEEELLDVAIENIEKNRLDKAEKALLRLVESTQKQSYVALYNLGVVKEANGNLKEAKALYKNADSLTIKSVDEISIALERIEKLISQREKALKQINN